MFTVPLAKLIAEAEAELVLLLAQVAEMRQAIHVVRKRRVELDRAGVDARETLAKPHTIFKRPPLTQF